MKSVIALSVLLSGSIAMAGNKVGNGGDVVVCGDSHQILDYVEAKGRKILIEPSRVGSSFEKVLQERLELLKEKAPVLGDQYLRRLKTIAKEIDYKADIDLIDIKDSAHAFLPKNCSLKQIAIRKSFATSGDKHFLIDEDSWKKLDELNRAMLIFHEISYEHFSKLGITDSRPVREFVGYVFSKDFKEKTKGQFWVFIKDLEVPIYP